MGCFFFAKMVKKLLRIIPQIDLKSRNLLLFAGENQRPCFLLVHKSECDPSPDVTSATVGEN